MKHPFDLTIKRLSDYKAFLDKQKKIINGLLIRNNGLGLVNWILSIHRLVYNKAPTKSSVKVSKLFATEIHRIYKRNGMDYLILYLKTSAVMLQQSVARNITKNSSRDISKVAVSSTRAGLPRIIPSQQRVLIRQGDLKTITF